ncbi:STAS domain-containing protein [Paludicola sp. MB14-C6]|uniref:STAS domain-containing protein n=1 Tax=Paludihabitans sp. MB14-C6 TaxID=3070656 RepID=UPI0027DCD3F7|nr:STAS domain-containing protein [Paludicola sp. MB14-C6]WMJ23994.1 STAS domain-containing protein [Paludicola sp. MB14-C6]
MSKKERIGINMVKLETQDDQITAYIQGDIDHHTASEIREEIDACVERVRPSILRLDFKDVTFMDSSGIGLVMGRYKLVRSMSGEVRITNSSSHIKRVMKLAGLDKLAEFEN